VRDHDLYTMPPVKMNSLLIKNIPHTWWCWWLSWWVHTRDRDHMSWLDIQVLQSNGCSLGQSLPERVKWCWQCSAIVDHQVKGTFWDYWKHRLHVLWVEEVSDVWMGAQSYLRLLHDFSIWHLLSCMACSHNDMNVP
jgi:hypothetical protein